MEIVKSYNKKELAELDNTFYSRIDKDKDLYIPIKIITAQTRTQKKWYSVRYVKTSDIMRFLQENPVRKAYARRNDKKFKNDLKNK